MKTPLRDTLLKKTLTRIKKFDEDVKTLYLFKVKLDEQLTISQLYLDTLQQELILLKVNFWPLDGAFFSIASVLLTRGSSEKHNFYYLGI